MSNIVDRRKNPPNKSGGNRQRFIKRVENKIKKALPDVIDKNDIKGMTSSNGKVKVPIKGIKEPSFKHDHETGDKGYVRPGNDRFSPGDKVKKPKKGGGGGSGRGASKDAKDFEEEFVVELTKEEFLQYFFQDLELPDLVRKFLESTIEFKPKRAGFSTDGIPARLNKEQSVKKSIARKMAITGSINRRLDKLKKLLGNETDEDKQKKLQKEIDKLSKKLNSIPFIEEHDLRYNNFDMIPQPTTSAVMFCLMDVSASMGYEEKDIAKRFFTLLYLFLTKEYEKIDLVFIRHTTTAKEVTEDEFFNSRESGGTHVSSALELMKQIINERYNDGKWNIYACQASDGDIWGGEDADNCRTLLEEDILKVCQYYAYIEIDRYRRYDDDDAVGLWATYKYINRKYNNFVCKKIREVNEIWPVFQDLFKKKEISDE